jgi:1-aminocyclopropane-1-carboxylate deaminase/D-cysteine desulfhydrase-like pyridoxal-dependent ACC family enzyme
MSITSRTIETPTLTREELRQRIDALARVRLAHLPTPLDACPRLSATLGGPRIYVKRDDLTGLAFGGNKTRQLEFLFAQKADTVIAGAYTQSNWCRQITAAAAKLGLKVKLVLVHGVKGPMLQGNFLLDRLMDADVTVVDLQDMHELAPLLEAKADEVLRAGGRPFVVQPFGVDTLAMSAVGYVNAVLELDEQLAAANIVADRLYLAGANITPAGIMLGLKALGRATRVVSICPIRWEDDRAADIARIAAAAAALLGLSLRIDPREVTVDESYIGEKYGIVTPAGREALRLVARTEGVILDPVYSSKAMSGLIDHIKARRVGGDETVVFLHTGGNPAVFAYATDLIEA